MAEQTGEELDHTKFVFGKHVGKSPSEIAECDPGYLVWLCENVKPLRCSDALYRECKAEVTNGTDKRNKSKSPDDDTLDRFSRTTN